MIHVNDKMEAGRITTGEWASRFGSGPNGKFFVRPSPRTPRLTVIASDGAGWEHVSVSAPGRCPTWQEMSWVKEQFWEPEDVVMQVHPRESAYVNHHPHCLHLWRPADSFIGVIPEPPWYLVGPKEGKNWRSG